MTLSSQVENAYTRAVKIISPITAPECSGVSTASCCIRHDDKVSVIDHWLAHTMARLDADELSGYQEVCLSAFMLAGSCASVQKLDSGVPSVSALVEAAVKDQEVSGEDASNIAVQALL